MESCNLTLRFDWQIGIYREVTLCDQSLWRRSVKDYRYRRRIRYRIDSLGVVWFMEWQHGLMFILRGQLQHCAGIRRGMVLSRRVLGIEYFEDLILLIVR